MCHFTVGGSTGCSAREWAWRARQCLITDERACRRAPSTCGCKSTAAHCGMCLQSLRAVLCDADGGHMSIHHERVLERHSVHIAHTPTPPYAANAVRTTSTTSQVCPVRVPLPPACTPPHTARRTSPLRTSRRAPARRACSPPSSVDDADDEPRRGRACPAIALDCARSRPPTCVTRRGCDDDELDAPNSCFTCRERHTFASPPRRAAGVDDDATPWPSPSIPTTSPT